MNRKIILAVCAGLVLASILWCQSNVGAISGEVTDSTGAAVPNAAVSATNPQTGFKRGVATQENGFYVFAGLPEGTYNIRVEKDGFRNSEQSGVILDAASRRTIDFRLEVGGISESVSVSAAVEQVQTASGDVSR